MTTDLGAGTSAPNGPAEREGTVWVRLTAVGGLVFFVLVMGFSSLTSGSPSVTDSRLEVWDYVAAHHDRLQLAAVVYALAMSAVLLWLSGLYAALRSAEGGRPRLAVTALAGGVLAAAATVTGALVLGATATRYQDLGPADVRLFWTMFELSIGGTIAGQLVLTASTAAVGLRTGLFSRWFSWASVVLAVLSVAGVFAIGYLATGVQVVAGVTVLLNSVWILLVSVFLFRRPELAR